MYFYGLHRQAIELIEADNEPLPGVLADAMMYSEVATTANAAVRLRRATKTFFVDPQKAQLSSESPARRPSVYRDARTKLLRCFYREIVVRFRPHVSVQR